MIRVTVLALAVGLVVSLPARTAAWSGDGHRIVCAIAFELLTPEEQAAIEQLTPAYRSPDDWRYHSFPSACVFADIARTRARDGVAGWSYFERFDGWHYLNVSRSTREIAEAQCDQDCVLAGIDTHLAELSDDNLEDWRRAQALFLLAHWVGDVHQPLHVSYRDDRGGAYVPVAGSFYAQTGLHAVWDGGIIARAKGDAGWFAFAGELVESIPVDAPETWLATGPLEWAQESYDIATADAVDYCRWSADVCRREPHDRQLGESYQTQFEPIVRERLQRAGVRLAALLRRAL